MNVRSQEVGQAEELIALEVETFSRWRSSMSMNPVITEAMDQFEQIRKDETHRSMKRLRGVGFSATQLDEVELALNAFSKAMLSKTLHRPIEALKESAESEQSVMQTFRHFFSGKK